MRIRSATCLGMALGVVATLLIGDISAQAPKPAAKPAPKPAPAAAGQVHANLNQLMRAIPFPNSNVLFAVQAADPTKMTPAKDPSLAVNPLESTYGGWQAVENASLALSEFANLLMIPGRRCANGQPVPLQNPDWAKFVQGLRESGQVAFKAAQSKNQDAILEAADAVTNACANCHEKWRDVAGGAGARCR